ncbi:ras and Rab interactor 2 [Brienomyrus brachyistius]|uniref:ras and Rab interactor 2 n=1 Tax=Brienomyrus brachyistius TaxID=42636 RepID=UPI0020B2C0DF|nr:ras and Rab interactor 2 [Brienomyrus brachyistius]XP_048864182.1 ras and Rab interactor 2 [Brienomyrus brachyistius]XP_048864183.1 ras and Rab interactor 2 [Brienomyrus brachyistius]XP_048864184.1 ras and Rab interactor 2 [Brienomyrus brachyistius]
MQMENEEQSCPGEPNIMDMRGSFFKLIHAFASEIGELNGEMVPAASRADTEPSEGVLQWLEGQMTGVYVQSPTFADPTTPRDSGYDSLQRHMSVLDRLKQTHSVWLLLGLGDEEAVRILQSQPPGVFLVRKSAKLKRKVISLRMDSFSDVAVRDFPVKETQYTFCLEGSGIGFPDLFRMVAFYCISRDVLPFTLELPKAIASARTRTNLEDIAQLGAEFWDSALCGIKGAGLDQTGQTAEEGCPPATWIRVPSHSSEALCFINTLFLQESQPQKDPVRPPSPKTAPLSSSLRCPESAQGKRRMPEKAYWINPESNLPGTRALDDQTEMEKKIFLYLSRISGYSTPLEEDIAALTCEQYDEAATAPRERVDSDNRISYMSTSTLSSDSLDLVTCRRLVRGMTDSSVEEEEEEEEGLEDEGEVVELEDEYNISTESDPEVSIRPPNRVRKRSSVSSVKLSQALRRPIHRMMDSLVIPERRAIRQVQRLVHDKTSYFGCLVQDFISYIRENHSCHNSGQDLLQTLRQFLTQTKSYLFQSSELNPPIHSIIPEHQIDQVLEKAMQKCVLKPLKSTLESALRDFQKESGEWQRLEGNMARRMSPQELGVENGCVPDPGTIEKIRQKFQTMHKMYSPEKKVDVVLQVCSLVYSTMERTSGADDFLPILTFTLAQCNMPDLDIEIQYMMELLDSCQLNGEGGYYLTSIYGAMSLIKNLQEEQETQSLISQTRSTLRQWHRRLTAQRSTPSIEDLQNYLRVSYLDANSTYTTKTLPVAPCSTTGDVCRLCAEKFQITGPDSHGLFLVIREDWQKLTPDSIPQSIKADIHSQGLAFSFVYRHV